MFKKELDTIINDDIREFATMLLDNAPPYLLTVAASSTGKYHPAYSLGDGGLARHTKGVVRIVNHLLTIEQNKKHYTERERDLIRVACLYHDGEKHGKGESIHTVHEHPLCASETVRSHKGAFLTEDEIEYIACAIDSHMGEWGTSKRSKIVLPAPSTPEGELVHLADYLASRKDIEILFDEEESAAPKLEEFVMPFGKYKDQLLVDCYAKDRGYFAWLKGNMELRRPLKGFVDELMKENAG